MRAALIRNGLQLYHALVTLGGWSADVVVTLPTWRLRLVRWLVALSVLTVIYQAYALLVVPLVEPSAGRREQSAELQSPVARDVHPDLAALFPEGAWERDRPMVLTTQWGKLLFREYRPTEAGRLELVPCTLVIHAPLGNGSRADARRVIVLQAPDKAVLNFAGPLNLIRAEFAKLLSARLEGEVRIWSRETQPGANDALAITTRNVQILPRQIWTAHDVTFQYGTTRGSGRDLSISLGAGDEDAAPAREPLVKDLAWMELAHLDQLVMQTPAGGLLGDVASAASETQESSGGPGDLPDVREVTVTSNGPLRFDFRAAVASLEDHVDIVRANPDGESDQLSCDRLLIYLEPLTPTAPGPESAGTVPESGARKPAVRRVEATGFPVTLRAPSVGATARGQQLAYDFPTRRILLVDDQQAVLVYRAHETSAPRLEYELHTDPKRLGRLWATGPGSFRGQFGDSPAGLLTAEWCGTLELQPQEGLHVLSITEGADITWQETSHFSANELHVWLAETAETASVETPAAPGAQDATPLLNAPETAEPAEAVVPPSPSPPRWRLRPVKMLAQGNVHADAAQFQGQTPRLEIWFDHPRELSEPGEGSAAEPGAPPVEAADAGNSTNPWSGSHARRLELSGDWIRLRLLMRPAQPQVREATVVGQVRLAQRTAVARSLPLLITGEMLQLRTDPRDRSTVDVNGTPARVHVHELLLEGTSLHVSQAENRLWADGPGRVRLPTQDLTPQAGPPPSTPPAPRAPIWISWQGGMDFDGQLIRFLRQVEVRGQHLAANGDRMRIAAIGDQLHAQLNQFVAFEKSRAAPDLDVMHLQFLGDVFIENLTYNVLDVMTSRDRMQTRDVQLDRRSGKFHAAGPGWITSTRTSRSDTQQRSVFPAVAPAPAPGPSGETGRLVFLRVDYQNAVQGNIDQRDAVFEHFVRTVYGPVTSWDEALDADRRGGLGPHGVVMTCQRLLISETGEASQRGLELSAVGNTLVEGDRFTARAQRLTYVQAKDQLVLDGENGLAQLQQTQRRPGAKPTEFTARQIKYWLTTGQVEVFGATQLNYSQVGAPDMPSARIR